MLQQVILSKMKKLLIFLSILSSYCAAPNPTLNDFGPASVIKGGLFSGNGLSLTNLPNIINVKDFGAVPGGTNDNAAAFKAAYDTWYQRGGVVIVPLGIYYTSGLWITNSGFHMTGMGGSIDGANFTQGGVGTVLRPIGTNPVFTIKYPTPGQYVKNVEIANMVISGSATTTNNFGNIGVYLGGGSERTLFNNVDFGWFTNSVIMEGDTNMESTLNVFNHCDFRMGATGTNSANVYMAAPDGTNTVMTYTTALFFTGGSHMGSHPQGGDNIRVNGTEIFLGTDTYLDDSYSTLTNSHCVRLVNTKFSFYASEPKVHGGILDGGGIKVWIDTVTNVAQNAFSYHAPESKILGYMRYSTGDIQVNQNGIQGPGGQYGQLTYPEVFGNLTFRVPGDYSVQPLLNGMNATSDGLGLYTPGNFAITLGTTNKAVNIVGGLPRLNFIDNFGGFTTGSIIGGPTSLTLNPPTSLVITGSGIQANSSGLVTTPTLLVPGLATFGSSILSANPDLVMSFTNSLQVFATNGIFTASRDPVSGPALYFYHNTTNINGTNALAGIIMRAETNLDINVANSGSGMVTVNGGLKFGSGVHVFRPPVLTAAQIATIVPTEGDIVDQSDAPIGHMFYSSGAWSQYLKNTPGTLGHYFRGNGTNYVDSILNASDLGSGTVPTVRLGTGVANNATILYGDNTWKPIGGGVYGDVFQNGTNVMTGTNSYSGITLATNYSNLINGTFNGVGTGLSALNGSSVSFGTVGAQYLGSGTPDSTKYLQGDGKWRSFMSPVFTIFPVGGYLVSYTDMATNLIPVTYLPDVVNESLEVWAEGFVQSDTGAGVRTSIRFVIGDGVGTAGVTIPITLLDTAVHRYFVTCKIYRSTIAAFNSIVDFHSDAYSIISTSAGYAGTTGVAQTIKIQGLTVGTATMNCEYAKVNLVH